MKGSVKNGAKIREVRGLRDDGYDVEKAPWSAAVWLRDDSF
jgi:hypothetical protein